MFTRDRLLSFGGPAILIVISLFQLIVAFTPGGRYSWWAKTGAVFFMVVSLIFLVYAIVIRRKERSPTL